jgi:hypothetical protein
MNNDSINRSISELQSLGFEGFKSVRDLASSHYDLPGGPGIYLVLYINGQRPQFAPKGAGGSFKGRNPNVGIPELESKWIDDTIIIYVGQTRDSLAHRITKLIDFGNGRPVGHYGGRYIWQIHNCYDLVVCWKSCRKEIDARRIERELLHRFKRVHGRLPFANLVE